MTLKEDSSLCITDKLPYKYGKPKGKSEVSALHRCLHYSYTTLIRSLKEQSQQASSVIEIKAW